MGEWRQADRRLLTLMVVMLACISPAGWGQTSEESGAERDESRTEEKAKTDEASEADEAEEKSETTANRSNAASATTGDGVRTTEVIIYRESKAPVSPLVQAAQKAREASAEKGSTKRVFTNEDLKGVKGSIIRLETSNERSPAPPAARGPQPESPEERAERIRKEQAKAAARVRRQNLERELAELKEELARVEESYYLEDQPDIREAVIEPKFRKLQERMKEVEQALARMGSDG